MYVGIAMAYYSLCRINGLKKITTVDFHRNVNEEGEAYYTVIYKPPTYNKSDSNAHTTGPQQTSKSRKSRVELFNFDLPTTVTLYVDPMISNTPKAKQKEQMMKNANNRSIEKGSNRIFNQVSSKGVMAAWGKEMAAAIDISDSHCHTGYCWRRTRATCLAEEGIS